MRRERALRLGGGEQAVVRAAEHEEERVTLRVDLFAAALADRLAQQSPVLVENVAVRIAKLANEPRRLFDVGEEERDRADRLGHPSIDANTSADFLLEPGVV
jgi:hypothetical protein